MKPLASNTLLQNRYLIVHLIGRGGMGEVYLAIDQRLGSAVAVKRTVFFDDEVLGSAFEREAKILARLRHNVLPKVSDHFLEDGNQYLVMEYIAGDDLSERLELSSKPFPLDWVMFWADRILDALDYLHSNEPPIIHRDIKPQNLKLTEDNQIVLLDFGLSKNTVNATPFSTSAAPSVVGYTPQYAPMEQIRGTGTDARSDIFSFSSTLYQLLTNVVPPDALTRADAVLGDKSDPLISPSESNTQIPDSISRIVLKGMEISRDKRIASAKEMQKLFRDVYSPEARKINQLQTEIAAHLSSSENISLKTNVSSAPNAEARVSQTAVESNAGFDSNRFGGNSVSRSSPRSLNGSQVNENFASDAFNNDAFSASHPTVRSEENFRAGQASEFSAPISTKTNANKKLALVFVCVGALALAFAAVGVGFYKYNSAPSNLRKPIPEIAVETAPQPTAEAAVKQASENPTTQNEVVRNESSSGEKQSTDAVQESKNVKSIQPPPNKINQKAAHSPDAGTIKPAAKATAKATAKPTPLPRILP